jgi:hypothetical protein
MLKHITVRQRLNSPLPVANSVVSTEALMYRAYILKANSRVWHKYVPVVVKFGHLTITTDKTFMTVSRTIQ